MWQCTTAILQSKNTLCRLRQFIQGSNLIQHTWYNVFPYTAAPQEFQITAMREDRPWKYTAVTACKNISLDSLGCAVHVLLHQLLPDSAVHQIILDLAQRKWQYQVPTHMQVLIWQLWLHWKSDADISVLKQADQCCTFAEWGVGERRNITEWFSWNPTKRGQPRQTVMSPIGGGPFLPFCIIFTDSSMKRNSKHVYLQPGDSRGRSCRCLKSI